MTQAVEGPGVGKKRLSNGGLVSVVLAVGAAAGIGGTWIRGVDQEAAYPSSWDPRVTGLVSYVEEHRGLKFKHPVYVEFLPEKEFVKEVTDNPDNLSDEDKVELAQAQAMMRSLGLLSGKSDLFALMNQMSGSGIIGLYSFKDQKIRVRGEELTPSTRVTLVHELTHALQDQQFDLTTATKRLSESKTSDTDAFQAIVEGDARRIEEGYHDSLSSADKKAILTQEESDQTKISQGTASVPPFMQALFQAPYPLGEAAVQSAVASGGNAAVDKLFQTPPARDVEILDPLQLGHLKAGAAPTLTAGAGEKEISRGSFGALFLYFQLAQAEPAPTALWLAEDDTYDSYLQYTKGTSSCVRAAFDLGSAATAQATNEGLKAWAVRARTGATVTQAGSVVTLNSCDPGASYTPPADRSLDALEVLVNRNGAYSELRNEGASSRQAICFGNGLIRRFAIGDLKRVESSGLSDSDRVVLKDLAADCR